MTMRLVTVCTFTLLVALSLTVGCKKKREPAGAKPSAPAETSESGAPIHGPGFIAAEPAAVVIPENADPNVVLSQLSLELRKYVLRTKTAPKSFEDFLTNAHVQAPPAPAGKKYSIQGGGVVLVKR